MASTQRILVVAQHGSIAELLVEFCSATGREALRPIAGETPEAATLRVAPALLMLDFDLPPARRAAWREWLRDSSARVLLFGGCPRRQELRAHAHREGLPFFTLPIGWRDFAPVLDAALAG